MHVWCSLTRSKPALSRNDCLRGLVSVSAIRLLCCIVGRLTPSSCLQLANVAGRLAPFELAAEPSMAAEDFSFLAGTHGTAQQPSTACRFAFHWQQRSLCPGIASNCDAYLLC